MNEPIRRFETGAVRSADSTRIDPEAFLSPIVLERFCEYMHKHRFQADGSVRDGDNWQKGMPLSTYLKGMWRHFLHLWTRQRGFPVADPMAATDAEEDLCAILFNTQGMLFELIKARRTRELALQNIAMNQEITRQDIAARAQFDMARSLGQA